MKWILSFCLTAILVSCKKEKNNFYTGTVIQKGGCFQNSWLVAIDNPNPAVHSFICDGPIPGGGSGYHCANSVYIVDMPSNLSNAGVKVKFSKWEMDMGGACSAFSHAPHHMMDTDVSAK